MHFMCRNAPQVRLSSLVAKILSARMVATRCTAAKIVAMINGALVTFVAMNGTAGNFAGTIVAMRVVPTGNLDANISAGGTLDANISTAGTLDAKIFDVNISAAGIADAKIFDARIPDAKTFYTKILDGNISAAGIPDAKIQDAKGPVTFSTSTDRT